MTIFSHWRWGFIVYGIAVILAQVGRRFRAWRDYRNYVRAFKNSTARDFRARLAAGGLKRGDIVTIDDQKRKISKVLRVEKLDAETVYYVDTAEGEQAFRVKRRAK